MYELIETQGAPIKAWIRGVPCEEAAKQQLRNIATLPFIYRWVAAMPDAHAGRGSTVGCVIATKGAAIPAAVGVDIGCGLMAVQTRLHRTDLPESLAGMRFTGKCAAPSGVEMTVDCHHNYIAREVHYGEQVLVTRKGAGRAREGDLGIDPGSMGARSFIVRGLGNPESLESGAHGAAGRCRGAKPSAASRSRTTSARPRASSAVGSGLIRSQVLGGRSAKRSLGRPAAA